MAFGDAKRKFFWVDYSGRRFGNRSKELAAVSNLEVEMPEINTQLRYNFLLLAEM